MSYLCLYCFLHSPKYLQKRKVQEESTKSPNIKLHRRNPSRQKSLNNLSQALQKISKPRINDQLLGRICDGAIFINFRTHISNAVKGIVTPNSSNTFIYIKKNSSWATANFLSQTHSSTPQGSTTTSSSLLDEEISSLL